MMTTYVASSLCGQSAVYALPKSVLEDCALHAHLGVPNYAESDATGKVPHNSMSEFATLHKAAPVYDANDPQLGCIGVCLGRGQGAL